MSAHRPSARSSAEFAYDARRDRVVLFGGSAEGQPLGDTWEWDGHDWTQRVVAVQPSPRSGHALAYDSARGVVVLFGGSDGGDETWEWDGVSWKQRAPAHRPSPRRNHPMAYDSTRGVVVLFGGWSTASLTDTWEWNGIDWQQRTPSARPTNAFGSCGMTYDAGRGVIVLPGAEVTWEWDGANWASKPGWGSAIPYTTVAGCGATFEASSGRVMMAINGQVWAWNGSDWSQIGKQPAGGRMTYHDRLKVVLLLSRGELWMSDGTGWILLRADQQPQTGEIAYDSRRDVVVLASGSETWEWGGADWVKRTPAHTPPPGPLVYDSRRGVVVLVGAGQTWEWDGLDWSQRGGAPGRADRKGHALTYDSRRGVVLLFGGYYNCPPGTPDMCSLDDLWEWDGNVWAQRASGPAARFSHALAYDRGRGVTILTGGARDPWDSTLPWQLGDTWEWDGETWRQSVSGGMMRSGHAMTYDGDRGVTVLFGGTPPSGSSADTWEYGRFLATPTLMPIANSDFDGDYLLAWDTVPDAETYSLQEADNLDFRNATTVYEGSGTGWSVSGRPNATWYYRVRSVASWGKSLWSEPQSVRVGRTSVHLPVILHRWPPVPDVPVLDAIAAPGANTSYTVRWNAAYQATSYVLEQATDAGFSDAAQVYAGTATSKVIPSQGIATYHYRVKAHNSYGDSGWSNAQAVEVRWEREPNNVYTEATGPVASGVVYYGYPSDERDYFSLSLTGRGAIVVEMTGHVSESAEHKPQLLLYYGMPQDGGQVKRAYEPPYRLDYVGEPGQYYILVYTPPQSLSSGVPYTLRVVSP